MTRALIVSAALALAFLGCGGADSGSDGETCPPGSVLDVKPDTLTVRAGAPAVEVWGGFSGGCQAMVYFTLSGPGTLAPASGIPVYYTPPAAVSATVTATITATGGGLTDTIPVTVTP
jgi:hypothetical protein